MDQQQRDRRFDRIDDQIDHMTNLLEDVLMIGRMESGHIEFNPAMLDIGQLIGKIIEEFQATSLSQHLAFTRNLHHECFEITADEKLMRQIMTNLISNAIKYSPEESTVTVNLDYDDNHVIVQVADEGIGIPKEEQASLFQAFQRASNVGTRQGTGLGLAITKRAVELHHGTILVESDLGQGACFTVTIPCAPPS
jgi:signal transduction histidine kinase